MHGPSSFFPWNIFGHSWSAVFPFPRPSQHVIRTPTHHPRSKWSPSWRRCSGEFGPEPNLTRSVRGRGGTSATVSTTGSRAPQWFTAAISGLRSEIAATRSVASQAVEATASLTTTVGQLKIKKTVDRPAPAVLKKPDLARQHAFNERVGVDVSRRGSGIPAGRCGGSALHPLAE